MQKQSKTLLAVLVAMIVALCGCAATTPETVVVTRVIEASPTATEAATHTPEPTATETPAPTFTPRPTFTRGPTRTPAPTKTPIPEPEVLTYEGTGDDVVDLEFLPDISYLIHVTGNAGGRHFAIESYDRSNQRLELLVNTTDPYDGWQGFDWLGEGAIRLKVKAIGDWQVELVPIAQIPEFLGHVTYIPPGKRDGVGDDVFILKGIDPDTAVVVGNKASRHFAVFSWGSYGRKLLINTTDPYEGTVLFEPGTFALEITAVGPWTIEIEGR